MSSPTALEAAALGEDRSMLLPGAKAYSAAPAEDDDDAPSNMSPSVLRRWARILLCSAAAAVPVLPFSAALALIVRLSFVLGTGHAQDESVLHRIGHDDDDGGGGGGTMLEVGVWRLRSIRCAAGAGTTLRGWWG